MMENPIPVSKSFFYGWKKKLLTNYRNQNEFLAFCDLKLFLCESKCIKVTMFLFQLVESYHLIPHLSLYLQKWKFFQKMVLNPYLEIRFSDVEIDMIFDIFGPYLPQKSVLYLSPMIFGSLWQNAIEFLEF